MNVLNNPIFWILIGAIVFVMAIIGYLAEGTEIAKGVSKKNKKDDKKASKATPETIPETARLNTLVQNSNSNISVSKEPISEKAVEPTSIQQINEVKTSAEAATSVEHTTEKPASVEPVAPAPLEQSAWTDNVQPEDEKKETTYVVPAADDWSTMPSGDEISKINSSSDSSSDINDTADKGATDSVDLPAMAPKEEILKPIADNNNSSENSENIWV